MGLPMGLPVLFCPQCNALIYDADQCSNCTWHRPATSGTVGKPAWAVALESALPSKLSHPVSNGNYVFFPTDSGEIVALNALEAEPEQAIKWRFRIDSRYRCHSVAVWDEHVVIGSEFAGGFPTPSGELIVVDAASGAEVWRYQIEGASLSVPVIHENIAYFTVSSGRLYAVDLKTRKELWQQEIPSPWSWAPYAPTRSPTELLILPGRSDHLVAFDIQKRNLAWTFDGGGWFTHSPVWVDGTLYARCWDQHIYALEGTSGRKIWQYRALRDYSSDLRLSDTYLYVGAKDFQDGAEQGANAYALYTLDRQTGERVGRYEVAGRIFGRPLATDSAVFFATDDRSRMIESQGTLYALDARGETPLWDPCVVEQRFQADLL
ncbi:MAG: PQQ-binding-like beta-propeller repeat protein, partial [Anaerolineae bacterium]|nr:PQQ-binding-like beta-propeller repeat protein [Anaerolineae bacterium]